MVAVQLTEDKQHLWTGDSAGILRVWDTTTLKLRHEVELGKRINAMVLAAGNMWIGLADSIQIRDQNDVSDLICEIESAPTYNLCVVGDQVWVGDAGKLIIYDVDAFMGEPVDVGALPVCLTAVGDAVWGACADRKIRVWRNDVRPCFSAALQELVLTWPCRRAHLSLSWMHSTTAAASTLFLRSTEWSGVEQPMGLSRSGTLRYDA